jgi:hypothetical protein
MNELTHTQVRAAKPGPKVRKMADCGGLTLTIKPNGTKLWHLRYRVDGKERTASLGVYPDVTLAMAREAAQEMRTARANGHDPVAVLQDRRASAADRQAKADAEAAKAKADSFAVMAEAYILQNEGRWAPGHTARMRNRLPYDINPALGDMPVECPI